MRGSTAQKHLSKRMQPRPWDDSLSMRKKQKITHHIVRGSDTPELCSRPMRISSFSRRCGEREQRLRRRWTSFLKQITLALPPFPLILPTLLLLLLITHASQSPSSVSSATLRQQNENPNLAGLKAALLRDLGASFRQPQIKRPAASTGGSPALP